MFQRLFGQRHANRTITDALYRQIVAAARQPLFYSAWNVPDTPLGRFEMLSVHMFLFLHRMRREEGASREIAQVLTDEFFRDVEHSLRELGIGDLGVPKRMKKLARMFYGRAGGLFWRTGAQRPGRAGCRARAQRPAGLGDVARSRCTCGLRDGCRRIAVRPARRCGSCWRAPLSRADIRTKNMKHGDTKHSAESPVSFLANVARLPQKGMPVVIEADADQRVRLAEDHGLVSVKRYRADLLVAPWKRHGVKVTGTVEAEIVQECVVTLDPLDARISEEFDAVFLPEDSKLGRLGFHRGGEIVLNSDGPDSPETFSGDTIDVGTLAEEFFALAIDPYPRKSDASLPQAGDDAESDETSNPLGEKLARLRQKS